MLTLFNKVYKHDIILYKVMVQQQYVNESSSSGVEIEQENTEVIQEYVRSVVNERKTRVQKILLGQSKATKGLNQSEVAELFVNRRFGFSSSSGNYESRNTSVTYRNTGMLLHYRQVEAVITKDNKLIRTLSDQCARSSFISSGIYCPTYDADYELPLDTINAIFGSFLNSDTILYDIEVLDVNTAEDSYGYVSSEPVLFRIPIGAEYRYFLYGTDEYQRFVAELIKPAFTVAEAYETMKPQAVKDRESKGLEVKRQGEWFMIPINVNDNEIHNLESACFRTVPKYGIIHEQSLIHIEEFDKSYCELTDEQKGKVNTFMSKEKYTPAITEDSNHLVQHKGKVSYAQNIGFDLTVVKGYVRHQNRDHTKLVLDQWHVAVHNIVKRAYQVVSSGRRGGFD